MGISSNRLTIQGVVEWQQVTREEVYLTQNGWVDGSYKHDFGNRVEEPKPADTVLTVRRHVYVGAIVATSKITETESPRISDKAKITELLAKFGKPTFGI